MNRTRGFTLIEVIVAISVLATVGVILSMILTRTFRAGDKSQLLGNIKQNGQIALSTLEQTIRDSTDIVCNNGTGSQPQPNTINNDILTIQKKDGTFRRFYYLGSTSDNNSIVMDSPTLPISNNVEDFCNFSLVPALSGKTYVTDKNVYTGVSVSSLKFQLTENPGFKDSVFIEFKLGPARKLPGGFSNQLGSGAEAFRTTVQIR